MLLLLLLLLRSQATAVAQASWPTATTRAFRSSRVSTVQPRSTLIVADRGTRKPSRVSERPCSRGAISARLSAVSTAGTVVSACGSDCGGGCCTWLRALPIGGTVYSAEKETERWLKENKTIKCSKCNAKVMKSDGCNVRWRTHTEAHETLDSCAATTPQHIVCRCGHQFCWLVRYCQCCSLIACLHSLISLMY